MPSTSLVTLNDNVLAAMDVETTGREPGFNEVCQVAIVILDCHLEPVTHFYTNICPEYPNRIHPDATDTHGLSLADLEKAPSKHVALDSLWDWFQSLQLIPGKRLIPLCHNCQFDIAFMQALMGQEMFYEVFGYPTRDTQALATAMMDKAAYQGTKIPFDRAGLGKLCEHLNVKLDDAHDALADALATARCYKSLMERPSW